MRIPLAPLLALALLMSWLPGASAAADDVPRVPCGHAPLPAYAEPGATPNVRYWVGEKQLGGWVPPACTGWQSLPIDLLVAVSGSFRHEGGIETLQQRIAAISSFKSIRYWSTTDQSWRPLVTDAYALSAPDPKLRRADFTAANLTQGQSLYYVQCDNRSTSDTVYRNRVLEASSDRLVVESQNVSPVRMMIVTLFAPGGLQSVFFIERRAPGLWSFYSLTRTHAKSSLLVSGHEASYVNRAVAFYRHVAGIPADQDPPVAR